MSFYPKNFIDELKTRANIVDVISRYVQGMTKRGKSHFACCPFHHEKTPSFVVNEYEQYYHCFGCNRSGDVIKFVEEIESVEYTDAVTILARYANMVLPELTEDGGRAAESKKKKDRYIAALRFAAVFYHDCLKKNGTPALRYLEKRKIDDATVVRFGIGYSPDYDTLPLRLRSKGYTEEECLASGVCVKTVKTGKLIDAMAERLVFPIINVYNDVIGFSGRILENKEGVAKYKNTGATSIFDKGKSLYGINFLKKEKQTKGINDVILVEGHIDLVSLNSAGVKNAVAGMGTAFTKHQAALLKRYSDKVYIAYDGDKAGQSAALRGLAILEAEGLDLKVIALPDGMDPDDTIKTYGKDYFLELKEKALPLYEYRIHALKKEYDLTSHTDRGKFAVQAVEIVRPIKNDVLIESYLNLISRLSGIRYDALKKELDREDTNPAAAQTNSEGSEESARADKRRESAYLRAARFILYSMLNKADYTDDPDSLAPFFSDPTHKEILSYLADCKKQGDEPRIGALFDGGDVSPEFNEVVSLCLDFHGDETAEKKYYTDSVRAVKKNAIQAMIEDLTLEHEKETDTDKRRDITLKIAELMKRRKAT
ncbi:MAG: DNA primase [Clostridiales bacterium]|jgi:DNA primase|nr:DNA primase [Clostridiales bacterium]